MWNDWVLPDQLNIVTVLKNVNCCNFSLVPSTDLSKELYFCNVFFMVLDFNSSRSRRDDDSCLFSVGSNFCDNE